LEQAALPCHRRGLVALEAAQVFHQFQQPVAVVVVAGKFQLLEAVEGQGVVVVEGGLVQLGLGLVTRLQLHQVKEIQAELVLVCRVLVQQAVEVVAPGQ